MAVFHGRWLMRANGVPCSEEKPSQKLCKDGTLRVSSLTFACAELSPWSRENRPPILAD